jgi:hypothetical protein
MPTIPAWMRPIRRHTVRPRSRVGIPILLCALMFAITATVVNRWGRERWIPVNRQTTYTATTHVVEKRSGETTPFTITDVDPRRAKELANVLAERFAADRSAEWRRSKERNWQKSRESAEKSREQCRDDAARLDAFERQQSELVKSQTDAGQPETPAPTASENPRWLSLQEEVSDLERRRDVLLTDRTPLHPAVQEIEARLTDARTQFAATPREIPAGPTAARPSGTKRPPLPIDDVAAQESQRKRAELAAALEKSRLACQRAERAEKQVAQKQKTVPQFVFQYGEAVQDPPQVDYGWRRLIWTTFAASLLMVFGVASVSLGAGIDPPVASIEEVEAALGQSVMAAIPVEDAAPDVAAIERQSQARRAAITLGVLLILACPIVAIWGVTGI